MNIFEENTLKSRKRVNVRVGHLKSPKFYYGWFNSQFGETLIFLNSAEVVALGFNNCKNKLKIELELKARWKTKPITFEKANMSKMTDDIFYNNSAINIVLQGTKFELEVWSALLKIPVGTTASYSEIAIKIGEKSAVRAVASAIGRNPIAWLIPCHRVLRKSGNLGGYRWGLDIKRNMLSAELSN